MTPPKLKKLFISYRSSDAAKVDKIARDLALLKYDDGTPRYSTWQDKHNLPPASPNWWDAIVDAIIDCNMFVMNISRASLQSEVCRAELDYAHKRNRPIIPVVLDGEFDLDSTSGRYTIDYWELVPEWLRDVQFLFYAGTEFYDRFQQAVELFERHWPRDINAPRPLNPDSKSVHGSNHALYDAACDYAERLAFADAEKHFDVLVRRNDPDYGDVAAQWLELIRLYAELIEIDERRSAAFLFDKKWSSYVTLYPKEFLKDIFDPKGFAARSANRVSLPTITGAPDVKKSGAPSASSLPAPRSGETAWASARPRGIDLLPAPFAWIEIPKRDYGIAKYPVTNAQFAKFIVADGYTTERWWTAAGWERRENGKWTEPRYWQDSTRNGAAQPVVGVSWYEAVAFCLWLSDTSGEKIMLPTEDQWEYAAQGDERRIYPWGKEWDASRCNNSVGKKNTSKTTPVTQYEGKGDSQFGVVDMAGNVWEWCLTDFDNVTNDIHSYATRRALRGGSWNNSEVTVFRCTYRGRGDPGNRLGSGGFRISLS